MKVLSFALLLWWIGCLYQSRIGNRLVFDNINADCCVPIRGVLAILIVLHHFYTLFECSFPWLSEAGQWGVPICILFFFFSGYGLLTSSKKSGDQYFKSFFRRRMPKLLLSTFIVIIGVLLIRIVIGSFDAKKMIDGIILGNPILPHLWFVFALLYCYITFYICFRFFRNVFFSIFFGIFFYCTYVYLIKTICWGEHWSNSMHGFIFGILFGLIKESISQSNIVITRKKLYLITGAIVCVTLYCIVGSIIFFPGWGTFFCVAFPFIVVTCQLFLPLSAPSLIFFGKKSMEIYLLHVPVMYGLSFLLPNSGLFMGMVVILTLVFAFVLNYSCKKILRKNFCC